MPPPIQERVRKRRDPLCEAGLRPVQIWVPDTRRPGFAVPLTGTLIDAPLKRDHVGPPIGRLDDMTMLAVTRSLAVFVGFA